MPSSIIDSDYYRDMFGTEGMRKVFSDDNRVRAWLEAEVALARAQSKLGVIPESVAEKISEAARLDKLDMKAMKAEFDQVGFPIMPFVHQLAKACDPEVARWIHWGATTQDILDTGLVIQVRDGLKLIESDLNGIIGKLASLAHTHRDTPMAGRTFQQHAAPITFGYKVAVWIKELQRHTQRLEEVKKRVLVGQFGGAVGTLATLGSLGLNVRREMMRELGLGEPQISWHTSRDNLAESIFWLAMLSGTMGKIATEIAILMRTEIGEVSEPFQSGRGASTTLPQKRNPISCQPVIAIAHRLREFVSSQLMAMIQEHERAVGSMHLEWMLVPDSFILASGSLKHMNQVLGDLQVDPSRMLKNLNSEGGLIMAESVMMGLAPHLGRNKAHDIVYAAASRARDQGLSLKDILNAEEEVSKHLSASEIESLMDPKKYTGSAPKMVDEVLASVKARETDQ